MATPAERQYDTELVKSLRQMAQWIAPRSRKVSDTLRLAAGRLEAISKTLPAEAPRALDAHGNAVAITHQDTNQTTNQTTNQPASNKPDRAKQRSNR